MLSPDEAKNRRRHSSPRGILVPYWILVVLCGGCFFFNVRGVYFGTVGTDYLADGYSKGATVISGAAPTAAGATLLLNDETNIPIPKHKNGATMSLEERIRYLELKTQSYMNFGSKDPFFGSTLHTGLCNSRGKLKNMVVFLDGKVSQKKQIVEKKCPGLFDQPVCFDDLPPPREWDIEKDASQTNTPKDHKNSKKEPPCLIYDFGIREQPQFGAVMARIFGCEVHAFDPSPVTKEYMATKNKESEKLRALPNYHFHPYGVGGVDGKITLYEYNWNQVSNIKYPTCIRACKDSDGRNCKLICKKNQSKFKLPIKTLPTIMKELGHEGRTIDVLKLDVEGSEYAFLEQLLDHQGGCPDYINQLTMEWHHYPFDPRYGEGASPPINAITTLLHACGLKLYHRHSQGGWPSQDKIYEDLKMHDIRYNVNAYRRVRL
eukprot:CAMPEP_0194321282 /NCGR_PEP_ID=MMETSP0171-20130528/17504_1 /TAXON_ID=218684 /ORGANISM="Corethron pennatum, Strain L29A3" /LENGTH=432 /DNA_ID=CAMNT_0039079105 /DNA_START=36 /DNA_END=1335 /DNA_ORIENTATION=-